MSGEKINIIESSISDFMSLSEEKKMYVLGFMQGVLINKGEEQESEKHKNLVS